MLGNFILHFWPSTITLNEISQKTAYSWDNLQRNIKWPGREIEGQKLPEDDQNGSHFIPGILSVNSAPRFQADSVDLSLHINFCIYKTFEITFIYVMWP